MKQSTHFSIDTHSWRTRGTIHALLQRGEMQMDKGLLTSPNTFENSIFLKSFDQISVDEIFSRLSSTSIFQEVFMQNTTWHLSHWLPLWRGGQNKPSVWLGCPLLLSGMLPRPHLGHSLHVHHLLFRTPSLGMGWDHELHPGRKIEPSKVRWGEIGGGWSQRQCRWGDKPAKPGHYKPFLVHLLEQISIWYRTE